MAYMKMIDKVKYLLKELKFPLRGYPGLLLYLRAI